MAAQKAKGGKRPLIRPEAVASSPKLDVRLAAAGGNSMTQVLVVEAASLVREMIVEALLDAGLRVIEAASAETALGAAEAVARPPEVLITAIALHVGGMDGPALAATLRRRWPDLGVIYLAEHSGDLAEDALDNREHCLMKPFEPAHLARLVCGLAPPCPNPPRLIRGRAVMR